MFGKTIGKLLPAFFKSLLCCRTNFI